MSLSFAGTLEKQTFQASTAFPHSQQATGCSQQTVAFGHSTSTWTYLQTFADFLSILDQSRMQFESGTSWGPIAFSGVDITPNEALEACAPGIGLNQPSGANCYISKPLLAHHVRSNMRKNFQKKEHQWKSLERNDFHSQSHILRILAGHPWCKSSTKPEDIAFLFLCCFPSLQNQILEYFLQFVKLPTKNSAEIFLLRRRREICW